ncbi:MAG: hypothetical protein M1820_001018 [Bogoriella megaspora]|nr:MAG: hypothetical protein M1820_001018 [Bogoriella megaspora]
MFSFTALAFVALLFNDQASAHAIQKRSSYPWNWVVAYGDELSDNGSGSYLANITGDPRDVYGFKTWTNGQVAVSYLTEMLGTQMGWDYAIGGDNGGAGIGATVNAEYTPMPPHIFSVHDQINWYINNGSSNIAKTMQFIWVGQNDLSNHTDAFWTGDPQNTDFATKISNYLSSEVSRLLQGGAPAIFIANIYPKHLAPVTPKYLCNLDNGPDAACNTTISQWGEVITQANSAIKSALDNLRLSSDQKSKIIYYDVFSYMSSLLNDPMLAEKNGITMPVDQYCDGSHTSTLMKWDDCMVQGNANKYFWMSFTNPTTAVHKLVAGDMKRAIDAHYASS